MVNKPHPVFLTGFRSRAALTIVRSSEQCKRWFLLEVWGGSELDYSYEIIFSEDNEQYAVRCGAIPMAVGIHTTAPREGGDYIINGSY